ncbi:hypothetical protein GCM10009573_33830 [Agromyces bracchium]
MIVSPSGVTYPSGVSNHIPPWGISDCVVDAWSGPTSLASGAPSTIGWAGRLATREGGRGSPMSRTDTAAETDWKPPWYLRLLKIATWILYVWVLIGVIALSLRVFLLLFAANPDAGFAAFVYRVSDAYLHPFRDIFPTRDLSDGGYLDVSALFAIIIYALIAGGIGAGVAAISRRIERSERQHREEMDRMARAHLAEQAQRAQLAEQAQRAQGVGTTPSGAQAIVGGYPHGQVPTGGAGYPPPGATPGSPPNGPATPPGSVPPY